MSFVAEGFKLDPQVRQYQLDQEVAAQIANTLYSRHKEGQPGNNIYEATVIVDPTGQTITHGYYYPDEYNPRGDEGFRVSFAADDAENVNELFGMQMQTALFDGERSNRTGVKGSLGITAVLSAIPAAFTTIALETKEMNTTNKIEFIGVGVAFGGFCMQSLPKHFYRLNMVKPGTHLNRRQLRAAGQIADSLNLPPVVK